jgi:hypothetical protein
MLHASLIVTDFHISQPDAVSIEQHFTEAAAPSALHPCGRRREQTRNNDEERASCLDLGFDGWEMEYYCRQAEISRDQPTSLGLRDSDDLDNRLWLSFPSLSCFTPEDPVGNSVALSNVASTSLSLSPFMTSCSCNPIPCHLSSARFHALISACMRERT